MGLWAGKEDLSPKGSRNLALTSQVIARAGLSARIVRLALLPLKALYAEASGTATSEFRLDLSHGHRRLVGVSVNCHTKIQDCYLYLWSKSRTLALSLYCYLCHTVQVSKKINKLK